MDWVVIEPDHSSNNRLARALDDESDGREWHADLAADMHAALQPGVSAVRGAIMGMSSAGLPHGGEPLRGGVAGSVSSDTLHAGASIVARKTYGLRGFVNAPKRLNARSFRHPAGSSSVQQTGQPGWFDDTLRKLHPSLRAAAERVLANRAQRISRKAPG